MTYPVAVVLGAMVAPTALQACLLTAPDTVMLNESGHLARVSRDAQHVWIGLSETELADLDDVQLERIRQSLGDEPRSVIACDISWETDADKLGVQVVSALLSRWRGVVVDGDNRIYSADQIHAMRAANQGFWDNPYRSVSSEGAS